jgi:hypothetical protein
MDIEYNELDRPSDVKVPWELSRCQRFTTLGRACWLTGDDRYAAEFVAEVSDWTTANPFAHGVNWACAMDVALRAVSWIWGFHFFADAVPCRDAAFRSGFLRTLFLHGEFVTTYLERADLNGNHYLCDGVGLVFLGCFFQGSRRAARWSALGRSILEQEMLAQTTADGVDFEQSTAYTARPRGVPDELRAPCSRGAAHRRPPRASVVSSACVSSSMRTRSRTDGRRSSATPMMGAFRCWASSRLTITDTCCRAPL